MVEKQGKGERSNFYSSNFLFGHHFKTVKYYNNSSYILLTQMHLSPPSLFYLLYYMFYSKTKLPHREPSPLSMSVVSMSHLFHNLSTAVSSRTSDNDTILLLSIFQFCPLLILTFITFGNVIFQ